MSLPDPGAKSSASRGGRSILPPVILSVIAGLALAASAWSIGAFAVLVALLVAASALDLGAVLQRGGFATSRVLLALGSAALALGAYWTGEDRIGLVAGLIVVGIASARVLTGLRPNSLEGISGTVLGAFLLGLPGAFAIVLRSSTGGQRLVFALAAMVGGYHAGSWIGNRQLGGAPVMRSLADSPTWWGAIFGLTGSLLGSFASMTFMEPPFDSSAALALGGIVGVTALMGILGSMLIRADLGLSEQRASVPGLGGLYARLDTLVLAIPGFYYGFRLYLT